MDACTIERILAYLSDRSNINNDTEISIEANPTSVELQKFRDYSNTGINRISIGIQSLDNDDLKNLGRTHTAAMAIEAIEIAQKYFKSISIDLIYARPGQTEKAWKLELERALSFQTQHLSLYQLTIEPNTMYEKLYKLGKIKLPNEALSNKLYQITEEICDKYSLKKYEISNFSKKGFECKHNLNYWNCGEWIGIGPGAHSRIKEKNKKRRSLINEYDPHSWGEKIRNYGHSMIENSVLTDKQNQDEYIVMSLRTRDGLNVNKYEKLGGKLSKENINLLISNGYLRIGRTERNIKITRKGSLVCDSIISCLAD
jgi:oxygen-independent coproporphyrinogen-3 oxidase